MHRNPAGAYDRRIEIQLNTEGTDAAGDPTQVFVPWVKLWAKKTERGAYREIVAAQEVLRDADTLFELRMNSLSTQIAPEIHRVVYKGAIYEILGIGEAKGRADAIVLLCSSRPDKRGERAPIEESA